MRINTKKILTWIYPTTGENRLFNSRIARRVCANLSDSGWRSLLFLLENKGLLQTSREGGETWLSITNKGKRLIEKEIVVLNPIWSQWRGEWGMLVIENKAGGKMTSAKRKIIKDLYGFEWQNGFYLIPDFEVLILSEKLHKANMDNVWLLKISEWIVGDWREKITRELNCDFYESFYSGVIREVEQLLRKRKGKKTLTESQIIKILNIFDRLFFTAQKENGLNILLAWSSNEQEKHVSNFVRILKIVQDYVNG